MGRDQPATSQESWYWHHIRMSIVDLMVEVAEARADMTVEVSDAYTWIKDGSIRYALDTVRRGYDREWPAPVVVARVAVALEYPHGVPSRSVEGSGAVVHRPLRTDPSA